MSYNETILTFIIVSFALAIILILKRETIPQPLKKPMAIFALVLISMSFILMVVSFFRMAALGQ